MINVAPYWARARRGDFFGWGWSFQSQEEAARNAGLSAARNAEQFELGTLGEHSNWYYGTRPMREPILKEMHAADGSVTALVTRNTYGCLVLNTAGACFLDVDFPPQRRPRGGFLSWLLRRPPPVTASEEMLETLILERAGLWAGEHPGWGWRIYRTLAGMRLLATHATLSPDSEQIAAVCAAIGADRLYQRLCKSQQCFRARLTPKSWRCGLQTCQVQWPCQSDAEAAELQAWIGTYEPLCSTYATCRYVTSLGFADVLPELQPIIDFHDQSTQAHSALPLA